MNNKPLTRDELERQVRIALGLIEEKTEKPEEADEATSDQPADDGSYYVELPLPPVALNNDPGLAAIISRAVGGKVTLNGQPFNY